MLEKKTVATPQKGCLVEITEAVKEAVASSGLQEGIVTVCTPDVDAGILITSFYDTKGHEDIIDDFVRIFPARDNFHFQGSVTEGAAHSKSSVAGQSVDFILSGGEMKLGGSQGIFLAEYAEPRERTYYIKAIG